MTKEMTSVTIMIEKMNGIEAVLNIAQIAIKGVGSTNQPKKGNTMMTEINITRRETINRERRDMGERRNMGDRKNM